MTALAKNNWKTYQFMQIANNIVKRVMPSSGDEEKYIGLEHMDTGTLHISRWGSKTELIGEKLLIQRGDILFARRNAYLKRVAIAPFDGIFSAHGMVLRPNTEIITEKFFPFFIISDMFLDRAIQISVGSLSPTVNWGTLKKEEFLIPPIEEQKRIAQLLWAADDVTQKYQYLKENLIQTRNSLLSSYFDKEQTLFMSIGEVLEICQYGLSSPLLSQGKYPVLRMMNLIDGRVVPNELKYINLSDKDFEKYRLQDNDILFNRTNSTELVGKVGIFNLADNYVFASYLIRLRANSKIILPEILNYILNMKLYQQKIKAYISFGVSQSNINAKNLKKVKIPIIPINKQKELLEKINSIEEALKSIEDAIQNNQSWMKAYLNIGGVTNV